MIEGSAGSGGLLLDREGVEGLGARLAVRAGPGSRLYLVGELGSGKSVLARSFLRGMGVTGRIPSPSFVVDAEYDAGGLTLHHIDLFRLGGEPDELSLYGIQEALCSEDVAVVEWADRLAGLRVPPGVRVTIGMTDRQGIRRVVVDEWPLAWD